MTTAKGDEKPPRILKAHTIATLKEMDAAKKRRSVNLQLILESHEALREALQWVAENHGYRPEEPVALSDMRRKPF